MTTTRKAYEAYVNEMRRNDRIAFSVGYREWLVNYLFNREKREAKRRAQSMADIANRAYWRDKRRARQVKEKTSTV